MVEHTVHAPFREVDHNGLPSWPLVNSKSAERFRRYAKPPTWAGRSTQEWCSYTAVGSFYRCSWFLPEGNSLGSSPASARLVHMPLAGIIPSDWVPTQHFCPVMRKMSAR